MADWLKPYSGRIAMGEVGPRATRKLADCSLHGTVTQGRFRDHVHRGGSFCTSSEGSAARFFWARRHNEAAMPPLAMEIRLSASGRKLTAKVPL
jgi:hypothetical protein